MYKNKTKQKPSITKKNTVSKTKTSTTTKKGSKK